MNVVFRPLNEAGDYRVAYSHSYTVLVDHNGVAHAYSLTQEENRVVIETGRFDPGQWPEAEGEVLPRLPTVRYGYPPNGPVTANGPHRLSLFR